MGLRRKVLIAFSLLWLGLLVSFWFISATFVQQGFFRVEEEALEERTEQIRQVIEAELDALETNAVTWAYWDDMYQFAVDQNTPFVRSNLQDASLIDFKIHHILIMNKKGRILISRSFNRDLKKSTPLPEELRSTLKENLILWAQPRTDHVQKGLISLAGRPALFVALPILTSVKRGPIRGSLVFVREFDEALVSDLSKKVGAPLRWENGALNVPAKSSRVIWNSSESVTAQLVWTDLLNRHHWTLAATFGRPITKEAQNTTFILFFFLTVAGLIFGFAFYRAIQSALQRLDESQKELHLKLIESKELTMSLEKAQTHLIQSQKFEALSALAGGVSRDFKAVIASLSAVLEALEHDLKNQPESMRRLSHLSMSIVRATEVVQKLLGLARRSDSRKETLELNKIVFDVQELLSKSFGGSHKVRTSTSAKLWPIDGTADQIIQAIVNLGVNARDAMANGGQILIETENLEISEAQAKTMPGLRPGRYACIRLSDTGSGIPKDVQERIFDPFFTTKTGTTSAGLGLSTVYSIMQNHGGHVTLYSAPHLGSVFTLYFPMAQPEDAVELKPLQFDLGRMATAPEFDGRLILLADDDYLLREVTRDIFESEEAVVLAAENGREALQIFYEHADSLKLAILDVSMPEMTGIEVYHEIRKTHPQFPIMFYTAYGDTPEMESLKKDPWFLVVAKPFQRREIIELAWTMIRASEDQSLKYKSQTHTA